MTRFAFPRYLSSYEFCLEKVSINFTAIYALIKLHMPIIVFFLKFDVELSYNLYLTDHFSLLISPKTAFFTGLVILPDVQSRHKMPCVSSGWGGEIILIFGTMDILVKVYGFLLKTYGPQGWWPLLGVKGSNPTKTGSLKGYHPGDYTYPKSSKQRFEICTGAILTQNTAWPNVEMALGNLKSAELLSSDAILAADDGALKDAIRPAGYFNQKSEYLRNFASYFLSLGKSQPLRRDVLAIKGIGPETADSTLLYAFGQPQFVIDTYTRRIFEKLGVIKPKQPYESIKALFEKHLLKDTITYQEYHALIVEHAKRYYSKKPYGVRDPLLNLI